MRILNFGFILLALLLTQCATPYEKWAEGKVTAVDWGSRTLTLSEGDERDEKTESTYVIPPAATFYGLLDFEAVTLGSRLRVLSKLNSKTGEWGVTHITKLDNPGVPKVEKYP